MIFDSGNETVSSKRILYTAPSFAKSNLLFLQEIGTLTAKKSHKSQRNGISSCLLFVVESGEGRLRTEGKTYLLKKGDVCFVDCRHSYSHETDKDKLWKLSWIHFYGEIMPSIYEKYIERGGRVVIHPDNLEEYFKLHKELFELAGADDYIRDMRINLCLNGLLTWVMEQSSCEDKSDRNKDKSLEKVRTFLEENYPVRITLDDLAEHFGISKFYLTRIFKEKYGVSINTYLCQVRITKAKNMLRFTDEKIENIGRACGLGEPNYFSRTFKSVEGITPSKYREKW